MRLWILFYLLSYPNLRRTLRSTLKTLYELKWRRAAERASKGHAGYPLTYKVRCLDEIRRGLREIEVTSGPLKGRIARFISVPRSAAYYEVLRDRKLSSWAAL